MVADAVRRNQSPKCLSSPGRGKFPGISQFIRELAGFRAVSRPPYVSQASDLSSESEHSGENSLDIASGNNRELRELFGLTTFSLAVLVKALYVAPRTRSDARGCVAVPAGQ